MSGMEFELRQIREGLHPTLKAELRRLEEVRQRHKAEAAALREARERVANEEFEREKKAAEDDFKAEEELLRDRFLNEFEERRRRTDEGRFDGQLSQMRAAAIRKMRTRSNVESGGGGGGASLASKSKREKLSWTAVQFALKPADIHDDFEELQRSYAWSLRHAEDAAAAEEAQAAKKPRMAPEQVKTTAARKPGARTRAPEINLKGKDPAKCNNLVNLRMTVWYEESTPRGKQDVPYVGTCTGLRKDGIAVRFDSNPGDEEIITNEDEWLWGEYKKKPTPGAR